MSYRAPAGRLTDRVTIERPDGPNARRAPGGQYQPDWVPVGDAWAAVDDGGGRDLWRARQVQPDATHHVRLYRRPDVEALGPDWRLTLTVLRGRLCSPRRVLNVVAAGVCDDDPNQLALVCVEAR